MGGYKCKYCPKKCKTAHGLMSHINTNQECRLRRDKEEERKRQEEEVGKERADLDTKLRTRGKFMKEQTDVGGKKGARKHKMTSPAFQGPLSKRGEMTEEVLLEKLTMSMMGGGQKGLQVEEVVDLRGEESILEGMDILTMPWSPFSRLEPEWEQQSEAEVELQADSESEGEWLEEAPMGEAGPADGVGEEHAEKEDKNRKAYDKFHQYIVSSMEERIGLNADQKASICLLQLLLQKKAPLDSYQEVMRWHLEQRGILRDGEGLGHCPNFISRERLLQDLRKRYYLEDMEAKETKVFLPHSRCEVSVWRKQARDNILSILTDPRWNDDDWLFGESPFSPPSQDCPYLNELNSGTAYRDTYAKLITNRQTQILVPIPLYIDGAVTGQFDNLQVTALKMSLGILNRKARDKEHAWRCLGLVPNYTKEDAKGKSIFRQSGHVGFQEENHGQDDEESANRGAGGRGQGNVHQAADYHRILSALLESLKEVITEGMVVNINHRGTLYRECELVFFVPFVKCDGDEGDKLCLHYRSRNSNVQQLCRYCDCPTKETDNPLYHFKYKEEGNIKGLLRQGKLAKLKEISQIDVENAFHGLRFGQQNCRGIHGACPLEMLHALLLGIFMYVRDCFFEQVGPTSRAATEINGMSCNIGAALSRQSDRDKPRTKFSRGIDKGKLMAKEYTGVLLIMAALLRSEEGRTKLMTLPRHRLSQEQVDDWITLVETMLQWEAFLKLEQMSRYHVEKRLQRKHQWLLHLLKCVGDRQKGMGFKLVKFHAILHVAEDIKMFGVPMNVDTGSNESHHKLTKVAARLTQKDPSTFDEQTCRRLDDLHVLEMAAQEIDGNPLWQYESGYRKRSEVVRKSSREGQESVAEAPNNFTGGTKFQVVEVNKNGEVSLVPTLPGGKSTPAVTNTKDTDLLRFINCIDQVLGPYTDEGTLTVHSEHSRKGVMFRSHPNYRKKGPWRDWVMIRWGGGHGDVPALIWGYITITKLDQLPRKKFPSHLWGGTSVSTNGTYAIIESTIWTEQVEPDALFREVRLDCRWNWVGNVRQLHRKFLLVDVEAFKDPVVVIPNQGTKDRYFVMTPRMQWSEQFMSWLEAPFEQFPQEEDSL